MMDVRGTHFNRSALFAAGSTDVLPYALAWTGEECGTGFYFEQPAAPTGNERRFVTPDELRSWPDSFRIKRVVVGMCPQYMCLEKYQPKRDTLQRTR